MKTDRVLSVLLSSIGALAFSVGYADDIDYGDGRSAGALNWTASLQREVDDLVDAKREALGIPGFAVGITFRDSLVYAKGYGVAGTRSGEPVTPETLFCVGSVSKAITATGLAVMLERGMVSLEDPISDYMPQGTELPSYDGVPAEITIWHLATHTAGLPRDPPNRRNESHPLFLDPGQPKPYSIEELLEALGSTRLESALGTKCDYSNYGLGLLGYVLGQAANQPFDQWMRDEVFTPLGMDQTTVHLTPDQKAKFAAHHWGNDRSRPRKERPPTRFGEIFAHGGFVSSVEDLAKLIIFQYRGAKSVAFREALSQLRVPQLSVDGSKHELERDGVVMEMGLGWRMQSPGNSGGITNHSGEMDGHSAYVAFAPESEVGVIVLANVGGGRNRTKNPTPGIALGVPLKELIIYPTLGWSLKE